MKVSDAICNLIYEDRIKWDELMALLIEIYEDHPRPMTQRAQSLPVQEFISDSTSEVVTSGGLLSQTEQLPVYGTFTISDLQSAINSIVVTDASPIYRTTNNIIDHISLI